MKLLIPAFLGVSILISGCTERSSEKTDESETNRNPANDYYDNGNIRIERIKKENGEELWIFRQEDGGCWEEDFYRDGEMYRKIVYNADCTKSAEYELKNGQRHGSWVNYHQNGKIWVSGNYTDGIPDGEMKISDTTGKTVQIEYHYQKDSIQKNIFPFANDLDSFKIILSKNKINFTEDEDIKVAGKTDYHFPILKWADSELNFDMLKENEPSKCISGKLTFDEMHLLTDLTIDMKTFELILKLSKKDYRYKNADIYVYDLKYRMTYRYEFENKKLIRFHFEPTATFY